ncbi:MAG: iron-containing redox enzyme family protein [Archangium sp.]|nr:iron-containing redox enzyme family protein [Archangium sp.]
MAHPPAERLAALRSTLDAAVRARQGSPNTMKLLERDVFDRRLYGIYLVETFHYTKHNARNQALVATRNERLDLHYVKFCLAHALEEAGHEYMALADLNSMGPQFTEAQLPEPLPDTETLIAYLDRVGSTGNPYARLGYSYWAESIAAFTGASRALFAARLDLRADQLTFLEAHAKIDEKHFEQVQAIMARCLTTDDDWRAVEAVMLHTLLLTGRIMEQVMGQYLLVLDGQPTRYGFLDALKDSKV